MLKENTIYYFGVHPEKQFYIRNNICFVNQELSDFILLSCGGKSNFWYSDDIDIANVGNLAPSGQIVYCCFLTKRIIQETGAGKRYRIIHYME